MGRTRAAQARAQRVIERAKARQARIEQAASPIPTMSDAVEAAPAPLQLSPYDQARVDKWIRDRLVAGLPSLCWHCRRPFNVGQQFVDVRGTRSSSGSTRSARANGGEGRKPPRVAQWDSTGANAHEACRRLGRSFAST